MQDDGKHDNDQRLVMPDVDHINRNQSTGPQQSCNSRWIIVAAILALILLTASLVAMIVFHFQQQSEWEKVLAANARENAQQLQQLSKLANEVAEIRNISQAHIRYTSCRGVELPIAKSRNETGGVFDIAIPGVGTKEVYCNTQVDGGGWIVFQRRMDGSVDFYRNWSEYVAGFGQASGEYWLGLDAIYQLTKYGGVEMRIDMIALRKIYHYAKYSNFQIGPASDNYRLNISGFSGNTTDGLGYQNNRQFSTKDNDNDRYNGSHCASLHKGAWWYDDCTLSNLNGVYGGTDRKGIIAHVPKIGLMMNTFTEMKLRKKL